MQTKGMSGGEALLRVLRAMGVETIFASPGSEWAPVWEALARPHTADEMPEYLSFRHEETAVAAAMAWARRTGRLPAVILHTTVGALHAAMAIRGALHERVPMVILAGESIAFGEDGGQDPGAQWLRLLTDLGGPARLMDRCVKWTYGLNTGALLPAVVQRACQLAMTAPRGPVFLSIPMEHQLEVMRNDVPDACHPSVPVPDPAAVDHLVSLIRDAQRPVIVTEGAGRTAVGVERLVALAERIGAPVVEPRNASVRNFPVGHPLHCGAGGTEHIAQVLDGADLVLLIETAVPWHPVSALPAPGTKVAMLGEEPLYPQVPFLGLPAEAIVQGDTAEGLRMILERLGPATGVHPAIARWGVRNDARRAAIRERGRVAGTKEIIDTSWVGHELNAVLPADAIVVNETISHRLELVTQLDRLPPGSFFDAAYGGLGMGLGYALGMKHAERRRPVITLVGDGSFNYNPVVAAFGACEEHALPNLVIVLNNAGYLSQKGGIPHHYPQGFAVQRQTFPGTSILPSPEYAALAAAFGGWGLRVDRPGDLRGAIERGLTEISAGRLAVLDVRLAAVNPAGARVVQEP